MATRYDRERQQWVTEFEQTGIRVYKRHPRGIGKPQAEAWEVKRRREIFDRVDLEKRPELTIGEAIDLWLHDNRRKNQRQAVSEAKQWEPWRGRLLRDAPEVASEATKTWTTLRLVAGTRARPTSAGVKASTVNRRLMMLKAACKRAWRQKQTSDNLSGRIQTLREPPHKDVYLSRAQVITLTARAPSAASRSAITVMAWTGLRASEFLALTAESSRQDSISVQQSKSGKPRVVPMPASARASLRMWLAQPQGLSYWELRKQFIVARKKAKLPATVTLHTLRHTCASWLINAGVDLYTVGRILGHSSPQTTARYSHLATDTLEKAMRRLK